MTNLRITGTFLLSIALAASSLAHDTWLIPDRFVVARDTQVLLDLTSGMSFPSLETSIKLERLERALCRFSGHTSELTNIVAAPKSLSFKVRLVDAGIATLWVELKPRSLQLTADKVKEYLDEIDAPKAIREEWARARRPRRWREAYTKHSKTFVRVGEPQSDHSWAEPVGLRLEIVPEKDPTDLRVGDEFPVRVLKHGTPFSGFPVGIVFEGRSGGKLARTDAEGRVTLRLDRGGRCLVRGTELRKSSQAGVDWESDFTTLTVRVGPE